MFGIGRRHAAVAATPKTWWTNGPPNTWQLAPSRWQAKQTIGL